MKISLNFIVAYLIGGITFIPFTIILILTAYFIYHQVILPIYNLIDTLNNNSKNRSSKNSSSKNSSNNEDHLQMNNIDTANNIDSASLLSNEDNNSTTTSNALYKVGWLKVTREKEEKDNNSIGDIVISYISGNNKRREMANIYFAVLKYSTLYLYDSEKQLDCKGVILLNDYTVSTWPPGLQDFELFSKPHTIQLKSSNSTFYVNCNKCIDKEDWFFTFLRASKYSSNQQPKKDKTWFDQSAMNHLITQVHSDEHSFQTQWLNAILGRLFFGVYKTELVKNALYKKVMSKLDKINSKRPPFLGEINVRSVDPGHALPHFTQPKLLGLSPTGELTAEAYMQYDGGFRIEIETSLLWKYSDRLKPLSLDLVLDITLKEIAGKLLIKIKEPPTNRFWYGFYECPKMEWKVEPVVWEKRVGYSVVVKAIEQKIQEFIIETMVLPHFDDITFFPTNGVGGIFEVSPSSGEKEEIEEVVVDKVEKDVEVNTIHSAATAPAAVTATTTTTTNTTETPNMTSSPSTSTAATATATATTIHNKKHKQQQQKEQQKEQHRNDEALLTTAKSLPELFSAAAASSSPQQTSKLSTQLAADDSEDSIPYSTTTYTNSAPTLSSSPAAANMITKNHTINCSPCLIPSTSATTITTTTTCDEPVPGQIAITHPNNNHDNSISLSTSPDDSSIMSTSPLYASPFLTQVLTDDSSTTTSDTSVTTTSIQITYSQDSGTTAAAATQQQDNSDGNMRLRKSSSLALLRPKTGASTAVNVSPAMAHKVSDKKDLDSISVTVV